MVSSLSNEQRLNGTRTCALCVVFATEMQCVDSREFTPESRVAVDRHGLDGANNRLSTCHSESLIKACIRQLQTS